MTDIHDDIDIAIVAIPPYFYYYYLLSYRNTLLALYDYYTLHKSQHSHERTRTTRIRTTPQ